MQQNSGKNAQTQLQNSAQAINAWNTLSPDGRKQAEEIESRFNPRDLTELSTFGLHLQANLNRVTDPILQKIRVADSGLAGQLLEQLEKETTKLNPRNLKPSAFPIPFLRELFDAGRNFIKQYEKISSKLEEVKKSLENAGRGLVTDIQTLENLYIENEKYHQELLIYIAANEIKLNKLDRELAVLNQKTSSSDNYLFDRNAFIELDNIVFRLQRRAYDLKLCAAISHDLAGKIRLIQRGDQALIEAIQRDILTVIPHWKMHMTTAILIYRQQKVLDRQRAITNATNSLLENSATLLQEAQRNIVIESERGIVDFDTLQNTHKMLINTIKEYREISMKEHQNRLKNEQQFVQLFSELRDAFSQFPSSR